MQIVDKSKEIIMKYFYSMTYRSYFNSEHPTELYDAFPHLN